MRFHDFFAGIGGSSTGLSLAGMEGVVALNHWQYAIELHNANHPEMDHDQADIWKADPRRYRPAEVGWFSPECRGHSAARGKKRAPEQYVTDLWRNPTTDPADDRSRLLMESVPHISALAGYRYVLVENVVDVLKWVHFDRWLKSMLNLGYNHNLLFLNSQFFGTPQSRDRFFAVFWKHGMPSPDLDFKPRAFCERHGQIAATQAWKPGRWWGKYNQQYVYICPHCTQQVHPSTVGAETVIDWSLPMPRIGDRPKGLADSTIRKIQYGLKRYASSHLIVDTARTHAVNRSRPADQPLFTQTTQQTLALVVSYYSRDDTAKPISAPLPTVPTENRIGVVMANYGTPVCSAVETPMPTVTSVQKHSLVMAYNGNPVIRPVDQPMPTVSTVERHSVIVPEIEVEDARFRMLKPRELSDGTGFPGKYILYGSQKNQVKGIGGSVDPHISEWIGRRILESLSSTTPG